VRRRPDIPNVTNPRLVAAVSFALLAACAGALAVGLEAPMLGTVAAIAGVAAAAAASMGLGHPAPRDGVDGGSAARDAGDHRGPVAVSPDPGQDALDPGPWGDLVDPLTGMLDARYFWAALERRVAASRRKLSPFSLVILELWPTEPGRARVSDQSVKVLAAVVRAVLRDSDTGCRIDDHSIGLLLEDTPEAGAVWATERVRGGFFATTFRGNVQLAVGIAAYPAHALEADRLMEAARAAARRSLQGGDQAIEIAEAEEPSGDTTNP
jgi:GGDEF domain-containing protein